MHKTIVTYKKQGDGKDSWIIRHCEVDKKGEPKKDDNGCFINSVIPMIVFTEPTQEEAEELINPPVSIDDPVLKLRRSKELLK